ncbi:hypothetical protein Taro_056262 [Colocasia esculenta]|uniref:Uncharacterized protein n=1 Tax=Colocasia esculenta TaxID=4460 RepID=A0A843XTE7_COLES|nr:hypothetical protein [Colocasia esculenta]
MVIPRRSGRKVEAEQQFGAFPLGPLEALGWEGALRLRTGFQEIEFLSVFVDSSLQLEARVDQGEGFPDPNLLWRSTENQEEGSFGDYLGLPKESFINLFDPFEDLFRGKYPIHFVHVDV